MPIAYKILKGSTLCYIRFWGHITLQENIDVAQRCTSEPDFRHGMPHLFDFRDVTGYERDLVKMFAMQARIAELYPEDRGEQLVIFCAPPGIAAEMVELARKSWESSTAILIRSAQSWDQACDIAGVAQSDLMTLS
ncbi:hypothetical protein [Thalassorhabdomicrobium marinisediminis]|uniref:hypothetical protein n=1 Tax=Thalassorhabdomicrobium marinisediminis TaxID=2170577 RepID=UPI002491032E|nr:hypothetical protein [Thalassorhabdomicrobium marinisediminis]